MSAKVIATIKLAPGQVGFYDPLSRIHLTLGNPVATVYSGTNCAALRRNVKSGIIRILDGTLGNDVAPFKIVKVGDKYKLASNSAEENKPVFAEDIKAPVEEKAEPAPAVEVEIKPVITPEPAAEDVAPVEEVEVADEVAEEVVEEEVSEEEAVEEVKTTKKRRNSKKKAAQEAAE